MNPLLPGKQQGWDFLCQVKANPSLNTIPAVILSHSQDPADSRRAYELRAATYMAKPESYAKWLNRLYTFKRYCRETVQLWVAFQINSSGKSRKG